jgi:hypothetical protein
MYVSRVLIAISVNIVSRKDYVKYVAIIYYVSMVKSVVCVRTVRVSASVNIINLNTLVNHVRHFVNSSSIFFYISCSIRFLVTDSLGGGLLGGCLLIIVISEQIRRACCVSRVFELSAASLFAGLLMRGLLRVLINYRHHRTNSPRLLFRLKQSNVFYYRFCYSMTMN